MLELERRFFDVDIAADCLLKNIRAPKTGILSFFYPNSDPGAGSACACLCLWRSQRRISLSDPHTFSRDALGRVVDFRGCDPQEAGQNLPSSTPGHSGRSRRRRRREFLIVLFGQSWFLIINQLNRRARPGIALLLDQGAPCGVNTHFLRSR